MISMYFTMVPFPTRPPYAAFYHHVER
jgi:hypothetical protein